MLINIITVIFCLGIIVMVARDWYDVPDLILLGSAGTLLSAIVILPLVFGLNFIVSRPMARHFTYEHKQIVTLQDGESVEGHFFLGHGSIEGRPSYTYYSAEGNGKKLEHTNADTVIVYQDTNNPYIVQQTGCKTSMEWLAHCLDDGRATEIHVPKGTIKENYTLDAQ